MQIDVYSHNFALSNYLPRDKEVIREYLRPLIQMEYERQRNGRFVPVPKRAYASTLRDRTEYRFHINQLDDFLTFLKHHHYVPAQYEIIKHGISINEFEIVDHDVKQMYEPREKQVPLIDHVLSPGATKMIKLQTGGGKTYIALRCAWLMGARTVLSFKGMYVDRWVDGLEETFHFAKDDLVVVRGSAGLASVLEQGRCNELSAKFLIVTNRTMHDYIKDHERHSGESPLYPVGPDMFHRTLRAGFHVMDEVHQEFHGNFRQMTYMHCPKLLALSATMDSSDPFTDRMYQIPFPIHERNDGGKYNVYISVTALYYRFVNPKIVKWKGPRRNYSHNSFEDSIMSKKATVLPNYFKMINFIVQNAFVKKREPGQRMLIFCASVEMCTELVAYLKRIHPLLKIGRYTQEDDYSVLSESDISVSTVLSAGTAVDIQGLRVTLMTTAINSRQSNEQALGRLREMKDQWAGITPEFYYLVCMDIDKHLEYDESKRVYFEGKVTNHRKMNIPFNI